MKKILFAFSFALLQICAFGQTPYTAPWGFNYAAPTGAPSALGTHVRFDITTGRVYQWSPDALNWQLQGRTIDQISGTSAPAYAPVRGQSWFAVNGDTLPRLYQYTGTGTIWKCLNCSDGKTYTAGTGIAISGTNVISNTAPDQTVVITGASGTYPNFSLPDASATNELNTGFDISAGNLRITDAGATRTVALTSIAPVQSISSGTGITVSGTSAITVTNSAPDQTVSIAGGGINTVTGTYPSFTVTGNEVDGSTTNEIQTIDTFSVSGSIVSLSLSNDAQPAKTITLPASGITSLNSQTGATQTFATGTTGTDVGIVSSANTHTFNFPNASASARGLLSSADWSTFNGKVGGSGTSGQVGYFSGTSTLAGSNNLFWDNANGRLGIGTSGPSHRLHIVGAGATSATFTAQFHNSAANNNAFLIRDDGRIAAGGNVFDDRFNFVFNQDASTAFRVSNANTGTSARTSILAGTAGAGVGIFSAPTTYTAISTWTGRGVFGTDSGLSNGMLFYTSVGAIEFSPATTVRMQIASSGAVLIGTTTEAASAVLNVASTTKGFLPPRMTATQASAIASPAEGLMVYVTNTNGTFTSKGWYGYNGTSWEKLNN